MKVDIFLQLPGLDLLIHELGGLMRQRLVMVAKNQSDYFCHIDPQ